MSSSCDLSCHKDNSWLSTGLSEVSCCFTCEHTCPERSKIQARAKDPSEYLAEIQTSGSGGRDAAQTPVWARHNGVCKLPLTLPAVYNSILRSTRAFSSPPETPPSWEGECTRATQRYLSIQQCTSSNGEKGGENWEGLGCKPCRMQFRLLNNTNYPQVLLVGNK